MRLETRPSVSNDSEAGFRDRAGESPRQANYSLSNDEIEAELDEAYNISYEASRLDQETKPKLPAEQKVGLKQGRKVSDPHLPQPPGQKYHLDAPKGSPVTSKGDFSKKLFGRRNSFCLDNKRSRVERELDCELDPVHMSMTSDQKGTSPVFASEYGGGSDLQRSNSNLLLRSMVSAASNTEIDATTLAAKVEDERNNLMRFIGSYCLQNGKVPKTTLQFYKILKLIGKGSFGKVHLAVHLLTRKRVALKCIDKQYILEEKAQSKIIQEVNILKALSHRNIIKILEVFENQKYVFIVTDYAARGDILQYMKQHGVFKEHKSKPIAAQILNALDFCHSRGILHRDVKLDNILLDKDFKVKLCDFGVSRLMPKSKTVIKERCGTPAYIAPEIIKNSGYSGFAADVSST